MIQWELKARIEKTSDGLYQRCKNYQLANLFPARVVALGCLYIVMEERGLSTAKVRNEWVDDIASRKVDYEDFEDVLEVLKKV